MPAVRSTASRKAEAEIAARPIKVRPINGFIGAEIEGVDLRKYLRTNGVLDVRRSVVIAHDVALALGAAHRRGIVHRDVKPQNILVNDEALVKLTEKGGYLVSLTKDQLEKAPKHGEAYPEYDHNYGRDVYQYYGLAYPYPFI